ncbi:MAG: mechanosensitive ion channel [Bacilli bacterium]|nr:mechanosensitive ion channel [Bacilli bacterium]MDD3305362.1 mechanosensitive ion channel [Bacilli bacterium]MDD4054051.1 mechanosensitive ion channel [Bacilli bacterium]MDD4411817.1 mechanosensitive ion channel [Bacilli bacterium]
MFNIFVNLLRDVGVNPEIAKYIFEMILFILLIIIALILKLLADKILISILEKTAKNKKNKWFNNLIKSKFFKKLTHIIPLIFLYSMSPFFQLIGYIIRTGLNYYIILIIVMAIMAFLTSVNLFYNTLEISKKRPIKGLIQIIKIIIYCITAIIIAAHLLGKSPLAILGGIGAFTAILMLIFQDAIVGFVSGIQIASNDMVRIGDTIDMPKYNASGEVVDISLTTIKVENFDGTLTTVPAKAFITDSFINWRRVFEKNVRRIKRSIQININSIDFCTEEQLEKFKKINLVADYIETQKAKIKKQNKDNNITKGLTNVGIFRMYIQNYLQNNKFISKDLTLLVRQLDSVENGLPIEIYAFTNTSNWVEYENIQANIFDHIIAIAPEFDLEIYQSPSGTDIKKLLSKTNRV